MKNNSIFGETELNKFNNGDLVSWKPVGHPTEYGIIKEIFVEKIDENDSRKIAFAIIVASHSVHLKLPLVQLNLESKRVIMTPKSSD